MKFGLHRLISIELLFMISTILGLIPHLSLAQAPAPLSKVFEQKIKIQAVKLSMDDILATITKQAHVSILVDDEPILQRADVAVDGSLHDALDKVSDTFDYFWSVSKSGVVLMSKRFFHPDERPQVNIPEMLEMTRSMVRALTMVDYDRDEAQWRGLVKQVYQSLTQAQVNALDAGTKLYGSDLLPDQKTSLQRAILANAFLEALKLWEGVIPLIENIKRSNLQAKPRNPTPPTHDYYYLYAGIDGMLHAFEIQHMVYGDNDGEVRTP